MSVSKVMENENRVSFGPKEGDNIIMHEKMGEKVMLKIVKENKKLRLVWKKGIWLGKSELNDEHFISTKDGVASGRSVHRLPEAEFIKEDILELKGAPWGPQGGQRRGGREQVPLSMPRPAPEVGGVPDHDRSGPVGAPGGRDLPGEYRGAGDVQRPAEGDG